MKTPKGLQALIDDGKVDAVVRQLKSGKEASVYVVACGDQIRCAKVYKDAEHRGFHKLAAYQEGRKARGSRDARAMAKRGRHGRKMQDAEWTNAEVTALYRLAHAGVRVPTPYGVYDRVLLMELVVDAQGEPAPRLNDVQMSAQQALLWHAFTIQQIVRMLCAGLIHGDLSEYNILLAADGPVIIDLPQAVNAAGNLEAPAMLERDVNNLATYFGRFAPALLDTSYGKEIWSLYEAGALHVDAKLTGRVELDTTPIDLEGVLQELEDTRLDEEARLRYEQSLRSGT